MNDSYVTAPPYGQGGSLFHRNLEIEIGLSRDKKKQGTFRELSSTTTLCL